MALSVTTSGGGVLLLMGGLVAVMAGLWVLLATAETGCLSLHQAAYVVAGGAFTADSAKGRADSQTLSCANPGDGSRNHRSSLDSERVSQLFVAGGARLTRVAAEKAGKNEELRTTIAIFASADGGNAVFWAVGAVPTGCWNYQPYAKVVPVSTPVD